MDQGEGKCLIFLHGWGGEIASFKGLADRLSARFRVLALDLYGFGATPHPGYPLTIDDYANGVLELMDRKAIKEAVVVGHSFGGRIAMRMAARSDAVKGLVLLDSAGAKPHRGIKYFFKILLYKLAKALKIKSLPKGSEDYEKLSGPMKRTFVNVVNEHSEKDAAAIRVPTLLIWGSDDKDTPLYMCHRLNKLIKDSESLIMEGAGHFAYLEHPNYVFRVIKAFRERI